jgi:hypothetical protein
MLLHKSEYSRNKGKFRDTRTPRALKKVRKNMRKGKR